MQGKPQLRLAYEATALLGWRTGVGEFCFNALAELAKIESLEVTAFSVTYRNRHQLSDALPENVRFADWMMPARPLHWAWERVDFPPVELWDRKVDVVHGTNFVVPPTRRAGKVVTVHDLTPLRFPEMCDSATLVFPKMIQRAIDAGAFVHTPSQFVAQEVVESFRVDPSRVVSVHHGVPKVGIGADLDPPVAGPLVGRRFVLALGTVEPRKDFPLLARAFDQIARDEPDLVLVIAGRDGWDSERLTKTITGLKSRSRIFRLGYVAPEMRGWLLRNATVFTYPSVYEGFGFPPLEAMSLGTPVVSSKAGALSEVLDENSAVLVEPGDLEGLASAIKRVVSDESEARRLSKAGIEHASRFSWEDCATGLVSIYRLASNETNA